MIRAETRHRMTRRLAGWDYSQRAIYMITVTLADRSREWLGTLAKNGEAQNSPVPGHFCPGPSWAEGFQDTILFGEGQLPAMVAYVRANPDRLAEKRASPELFRRVARLVLLLDGGRLAGRFEAIGNRHLLERPLHQVQCSRGFFAYRRVPKTGGASKLPATPQALRSWSAPPGNTRSALQQPWPPPHMAPSS